MESETKIEIDPVIEISANVTVNAMIMATVNAPETTVTSAIDRQMIYVLQQMQSRYTLPQKTQKMLS
jgi:hypothetical protein